MGLHNATQPITNSPSLTALKKRIFRKSKEKLTENHTQNHKQTAVSQRYCSIGKLLA